MDSCCFYLLSVGPFFTETEQRERWKCIRRKVLEFMLQTDDKLFFFLLPPGQLLEKLHASEFILNALNWLGSTHTPLHTRKHVTDGDWVSASIYAQLYGIACVHTFCCIIIICVLVICNRHFVSGRDDHEMYIRMNLLFSLIMQCLTMNAC